MNGNSHPAQSLKDAGLWRSTSYINGEWLEADGTFPVYGAPAHRLPKPDFCLPLLADPGNGKVLGDVSHGGAAEVDKAVEAAQAAYLSWRELTGKQRGDYLARLASLMKENMCALQASPSYSLC